MKKYLKILLMFLILIILAIALIVINNNKNNNMVEKKTNNLNVSKEVSNVIFTNINYKVDNNGTIVSLKIFNNNDKDIKLNEYIVNVYDKNNKLLGTMKPIVKDTIKKINFLETEFSIKEKYDNAYSLEIELPNLELLDSE